MASRRAAETTILAIGLDYEREAAALVEWLRSRGASAVSFSRAILPFVDERAGLRYWRDVVGQEEELRSHGEAYERFDELARALEATELASGKAFLSGVRHAWAVDLFALLVLSDRANERPGSVAVLDLPFGPAPVLPAGWCIDSVGDCGGDYPIAEVLRAEAEVCAAREGLAVAEREALGAAHPLAPAVGRSEGRVLVVVEDSGSEINITSARALCHALVVEGLEPVVLTSLAGVADALADDVHAIHRVPEELGAGYAAFVDELGRLVGALEAFVASRDDPVWSLFLAVQRPRIYAALRFCLATRDALRALRDAYGLRVAILVNEGNQLPACAALWLGELGVESIGISPVLYMDHPMCTHWPAERHLVYGEQAVEIMVARGVPRAAIEVAGTEHFDRARDRDAEGDRALIREGLPGCSGKRVVVVASENRPRQMVEIEPSVRVLAGIPGVFTIIKLHPSDVREPFDELLAKLAPCPQVAVVAQIDVHALVHAADLLVTMGSNLVIEAAILGTPSLVHNYSGSPCPIDFVAEGLAAGAESPEAFGRSVRSLLFDEAEQEEAKRRLARVSRYNGPNDGRSAERIARRVAAVHDKASGHRRGAR